MKKKIGLTVLCTIMTLLVLTVSGCYYFKYQMYFYFQDDNHYDSVEGFYCGEGTYDNCILIRYKTYQNEELTIDFQLESKSIQILKDNGFFEEVKNEDAIIFTTSFEMFSAGWIYPVVEIWSNEKCYLDYETGKANLIDSFK